MDISKVERILKVCKLVKQMPVGQGYCRAGDIVQWSGIANATTYRYLKKMLKLNLVDTKTKKYLGRDTLYYVITDLGQEYLSDFRELEMIL